MNKKNKEKLKNFKDSIKDFFNSQKPRPKRDWTFMLLFFFGFLFFLTSINTFLFFYWSNIYDKGSGDTETLFEGEVLFEDKDIDLNKEKIDNVWNFFKDKENNFNNIEENWLIKSPLSIEVVSVEDKDEEEEKTENNETEEDLTENLF